MRVFASDWTQVVAVGMGVLLAVSVVGVGALDAQASGSTSPEPAVHGVIGTQDSENNTTVTTNRTIEAMRVVENRTNGTVVGARLKGRGGGKLERSTFVYQFDVLASNGSQLVAKVYARNATVISVEPANESDGIFEDLFGSDDGVPKEARNRSALRSAIEAVRLAVNETESNRTNQTVTEVTLGKHNDTLAYTVTLFVPSGEPREVVVAALEGKGGVVTTDPKNDRRRPRRRGRR